MGFTTRYSIFNTFDSSHKNSIFKMHLYYPVSTDALTTSDNKNCSWCRWIMIFLKKKKNLGISFWQKNPAHSLLLESLGLARIKNIFTNDFPLRQMQKWNPVAICSCNAVLITISHPGASSWKMESSCLHYLCHQTSSDSLSQCSCLFRFLLARERAE